MKIIISESQYNKLVSINSPGVNLLSNSTTKKTNNSLGNGLSKLLSLKGIKESVEDVEGVETKSLDFAKVYSDCYPKVFGQICLRYSDGDYEKAQDYCQDGFVKAYQKQGQFTGTNVCAWISSLMRNHIIDEMRKEKREGFRVSLDKTKLGSYDVDTNDDDNDEFYSKKYSPKDIQAAISTLSPKYKEIFVKYYMDDMQHQEIADELGINVGTSKSNLFKAKKNVLDYLKNLKRD
jgi:RNA polymerase sigma-70 factor (ECF subfamily)